MPWEFRRLFQSFRRPALRLVHPADWPAVWSDEPRLALGFVPASPSATEVGPLRHGRVNFGLDQVLLLPSGSGALLIKRASPEHALWGVSVLRRDSEGCRFSLQESSEPTELGMQRYTSHTTLTGAVRLSSGVFDELARVLQEQRDLVAADGGLYLMVGVPHHGTPPTARPIAWNGRIDDPLRLDLAPSRLWVRLSRVPAGRDRLPVALETVREWMVVAS